ncbi:MAG: T9SS type A sorting domain-containing protein [Flavobacteriales bacterium]|nr:T9SS type A sorting domain-containing protein [Flavobacteriales bacterium]
MWRSTLLCCCISVNTLAQTGPGGVGNSTTNFLWLSAEHDVTVPSVGVSRWGDRSGNGNHALQATANRQPLLTPGSFNGYPAITFDNDPAAADLLTIADNATLEGMNGLTGFAVFDLAAGTALAAPRGILSKRVDPGAAQNAYAWFLWQSGSNLAQHLDIVGTGNRISSPGSHAINTVYINSFTYHGATPTNSQDQVLLTGNTAVANGAETSTSIPNYTSNLHIGQLYGHTGAAGNTTRFNGRIAEIILFNTTLTSVPRTIIHNYLAAKYGRTLASLDLYIQDEELNGNFDHDVAGIGRAGSTDLHDDAQGTGLLRINNPSDLNNNEYLVWGHDNGILGAWGVGDRPSGVEGRWDRTWRINEVNASGTAVNVGAVDMTFDLSTFGPVTASHLRLLVDSDNDGNFADETPLSGAIDLGSGRYRFSGVTALTNGVRFTLGTTDLSATPLPVELVVFNAEALAGSVHLNWTTASEQDNAYFTVERSTDLTTWEGTIEVPGAGTSHQPLSYAAIDRTPHPGTNYYRLRQTDHNGTTSLSDLRAVDTGHAVEPGWTIQPMPFAHEAQVISGSSPLLEIAVHTLSGQRVALPVRILDGLALLDTDALLRGTYLLSVTTSAGRSTRRVVKE